MPSVTASIIICTHNRAEHLRRTLENLAHLEVSPEATAEILVVDNASDDNTAEIINSVRLSNLPIRYVYHARKGKSFGFNEGMRQAEGKIILSTDDDVRLPPDWIARMCAPILADKAEGVAGAVLIAPHLRRDWMTAWHRMYLASTEAFDPANPPAMTGANMAFRKSVLATVPGFDPELGPGGLGFYDDTLFSFQMKQAGFRIVSAFDVVAEHHPEESRLKRAQFGASSAKDASNCAYVHYHWEHKSFRKAAPLLLYRRVRLAMERVRRRNDWLSPEGMPEWEMKRLYDVHYCRQFLIESKRPRNYDRFGLVKKAGILL